MAKIKYVYNEDAGEVAKAAGRSLKISPNTAGKYVTP